MNNRKIRAIADSAAGAALCTLLMLIALYVPVIAAFASIVCGLPIMCLFYKHNTVHGILAFVCAVLLAFILTGNMISVGVLALTYALPAIVFGIVNSKGKKFSTAVIVASVFTLIGVVIEFVALNGSGSGIRDSVSVYTNRFQTVFNDAAASSGINIGTDMSAAVAQVVEQVVDGVMYYLPTIIICIAVFYTYIIALLSVFVLKRLRIKNVKYTEFNRFAAPRVVCHVTALLFIVTLVVRSEGLYIATIKNVLLISEIILGISGFAFVDLKFSNAVKQWYIRLIVYIGVWFFAFMLVPFLAEIMIVIGFFRSLYQNSLGNGSGGNGNED